MPAIFVPYAPGDLFKYTSGGAAGLVSIQEIDSVISASNLAMYTSIAISVNQTVQYLLTFGDMIRYINFGRGLGSVTINGILFCNCQSRITAGQSFYSTVNPLRGTVVNVSMLGYACRAVLVNVNTELVAEPDTMVNFSIQLNIVSDQ
jgi:hypothetical protein